MILGGETEVGTSTYKVSDCDRYGAMISFSVFRESPKRDVRGKEPIRLTPLRPELSLVSGLVDVDLSKF